MIKKLHEIHVILFAGLPVPSTFFFYSCARVFRANMFGNVRARDPRNVIMPGTWRELSLMNGTDSRNVSALTSLRQCAADAEP